MAYTTTCSHILLLPHILCIFSDNTGIYFVLSAPYNLRCFIRLGTLSLIIYTPVTLAFNRLWAPTLSTATESRTRSCGHHRATPGALSSSLSIQRTRAPRQAQGAPKRAPANPLSRLPRKNLTPAPQRAGPSTHQYQQNSFALQPCFAALPCSLAIAALPCSLALQPCHCSLAWQPCFAALCIVHCSLSASSLEASACFSPVCFQPLPLSARCQHVAHCYLASSKSYHY